MSIFSFVYFTSFYKKAGKPGVPFLKGTIAFWVSFIAFETPIYMKTVINKPFITMLDNSDKASQIMQLPVLAAGIVIFILSWILTYKVSANRFEKVDL